MTDDDSPEAALLRLAAGAKRPAERHLAPGRVESRDLFQGRKELVIVHDGRDYRLRITQNGKLILTA